MDRGAETNKQIDFTVNLKDVYILKNLLTDFTYLWEAPIDGSIELDSFLIVSFDSFSTISSVGSH